MEASPKVEMTQLDGPLYKEFKSLLDSATRETPLQTFFEKHPEILQVTFNQGAYYPTVFPKFHLADNFVPDFVMIGHRSVWSWDVDLIEIEPAVIEGGLFNNKRQPKGRLRDAEAQIKDWQVWMERHRDNPFTRRALEMLKEKKAWDEKPQFYNPSDGTRQSMNVWYRIIIGRRDDFEGWGQHTKRLLGSNPDIDSRLFRGTDC